MKKVYDNNNDLIFSSLKVKKIIQENKEIGKIANMSPYVISKSLEYFIKDLISEAAQNTKELGSNAIQRINLKNVVMKRDNLKFLRYLVEDIEEVKPTVGKKKKDTKEKTNSKSNINED